MATANNYFEPGRMVSQFLPTAVISTVYQVGGVDSPVLDGTLAVLGGFYTDPVYSAAYTAGSGSAVTILDFNTRIAVLPTLAIDAGVGVINVVDVPTATGADNNSYRIGTQIFGLTGKASTPYSFRVFALNDTCKVNSDNTTATLTVGQYAIVSPTAGKFAPSATIPATGLVAKVISSTKVSKGNEASVTQYFLLIVQI